MAVTPMRKALGSHLCTVSLYRAPTGEIVATLDDRPIHVIEAQDTITQRFFKVAQWCVSASMDFMRQGVRFDDETRKSVNDDASGQWKEPT